jgi:hypothetical protein
LLLETQLSSVDAGSHLGHEHCRAPKIALSQPLGLCQDTLVPTVLRIDGFRVVIYPNDHRPDHVHVIGSGMEAVFVLNCPGGPVSLRENFGFAARVLRTVGAVLDADVDRLCEA